jgi:hypothetical protein
MFDGLAVAARGEAGIGGFTQLTKGVVNLEQQVIGVQQLSRPASMLVARMRDIGPTEVRQDGTFDQQADD